MKALCIWFYKNMVCHKFLIFFLFYINNIKLLNKKNFFKISFVKLVKNLYPIFVFNTITDRHFKRFILKGIKYWLILKSWWKHRFSSDCLSWSLLRWVTAKCKSFIKKWIETLFPTWKLTKMQINFICK